jgi:pyruvate/2-oxoglutarate dehydrogenase complex dihydrolipoamide dehydrogenase (E3) component
LKKAPGKTLVVGGGYVAVEIAGFLRGMGCDITLMTRGDYLRAFDRDMVRYLIDDMRQKKINVVPTSLPKNIKRNPDNHRLDV